MQRTGRGLSSSPLQPLVDAVPHWLRGCCPALCAVLVAFSSHAESAGYATQGRCAGFPRLALTAPEGWCVGLVADARDGLQMPRRLLEVAPGRFWITDMGGWDPHRGRLLELNTAGQPGDRGRMRVLARGLDRPHGLVRGPDRRIYIGEAGTVWRTPPSSVERETVLRDLPSDGAHPLKEMVFGSRGRMFLNVGSATDACRDEQQGQPLPCPESRGPQPRAAVYEATLGGPDFTLQTLRPFALGLRNSLGLALTHDGVNGAERLWQAENSVDYKDERLPAEELNELRRGTHHGWPYCLSTEKGRSVVARGYEKRAQCDQPDHQVPYAVWPAHVAPLQLLAVPPVAEGQTEQPWSGRLLAVWHGHRDQGQRIVAWRLGPDGRPGGEREDIVSGWQAAAGLRPLGSPAGITLDSQGRLWVVEDRNRTVLVVAPDTGSTLN